MLTCIRSSTEQELNVENAINLIAQGINLKEDLVDKIFGVPVFLRRSHFRSNHYVRGHFVLKSASIPKTFPEDLHLDREYFRLEESKKVFRYRESIEHIEGKKFIGTEGIINLYGESCTPLVSYELIIKLESGKRRIIDVAFITPDGTIEAHEVQFSAITPEELEERTSDYEDACIPVVWWFGKAANTQANRDWYYHRFGELAPILSFDENHQHYSFDNTKNTDKSGFDKTEDSFT